MLAAMQVTCHHWNLQIWYVQLSGRLNKWNIKQYAHAPMVVTTWSWVRFHGSHMEGPRLQTIKPRPMRACFSRSAAIFLAWEPTTRPRTALEPSNPWARCLELLLESSHSKSLAQSSFMWRAFRLVELTYCTVVHFSRMLRPGRLLLYFSRNNHHPADPTNLMCSLRPGG